MSRLVWLQQRLSNGHSLEIGQKQARTNSGIVEIFSVAIKCELKYGLLTYFSNQIKLTTEVLTFFVLYYFGEARDGINASRHGGSWERMRRRLFLEVLTGD